MEYLLHCNIYRTYQRTMPWNNPIVFQVLYTTSYFKYCIQAIMPINHDWLGEECSWIRLICPLRDQECSLGFVSLTSISLHGECAYIPGFPWSSSFADCLSLGVVRSKWMMVRGKRSVSTNPSGKHKSQSNKIHPRRYQSV